MLHTIYQGSRPYGFRQEYFQVFPYISMCKIWDPQGSAIFRPRGIIWTNLVERSIRWCYIPNIKVLGLMVSDKKLFPCFSLSNKVRVQRSGKDTNKYHTWPRIPMGKWKLTVRHHKQRSRGQPFPCRWPQSTYKQMRTSICKTCDPWGRAIFGPRGIILTNLVEVH